MKKRSAEEAAIVRVVPGSGPLSPVGPDNWSDDVHILDLESPPSPEGNEEDDLGSKVATRFAISRQDAVLRLVALRVALHDFLRANGVTGITDPRISPEVRNAISRLNTCDDVLLNLPDELLEALADFQRG